MAFLRIPGGAKNVKVKVWNRGIGEEVEMEETGQRRGFIWMIRQISGNAKIQGFVVGVLVGVVILWVLR